VNWAGPAALGLALVAVSAWAAETVPIKITAVQATTEGADPKEYGKKLDELKSSLGKLKYDTFELIAASEVKAPFGKETCKSINDRYTLCITPKSKDDKGRIHMDIRIEDKRPPKKDGEKAKKVNAVKTTVQAVPGKTINFHGLDLKKGKLVVVLQVS
jgi:hypothetical protein